MAENTRGPIGYVLDTVAPAAANLPKIGDSLLLVRLRRRAMG